MTQKLLLAEGINLLRQAEVEEAAVDRKQLSVASSDKFREHISSLYNDYDKVCSDYLLSAEIINYVRRCALQGNMDTNKRNLIDFCEKQMTVCMNRCEIVRAKRSNILLPLDQMDAYAPKKGFELGEPIFIFKDPCLVLDQKRNFTWTVTLDGGSYIFWVKNLDSYAVATPKVVSELQISVPQKRTQQVEKVIPCQCGWKSVVGVLEPATVRVAVKTDAILRSSHIEVGLCRLKEIDPPTEVDSLAKPTVRKYSCDISHPPNISNDEAVALLSHTVPNDGLPTAKAGGNSGISETDIELELQSVEVPCVKSDAHPFESAARKYVEAGPLALSCSQRLQQIENILHTWSTDGVIAVPLGKEQQRIIKHAYVLPSPVEVDDLDGI
uniref:Uncharacterized protein n=1 Tax=Trypanosoma congolense (strain IL3000) TaxID=1068625 RepID=G0UQI0_TRYCI|nr:conserved hypothetical protein [Trypanosoma congolense IL3000]